MFSYWGVLHEKQQQEEEMAESLNEMMVDLHADLNVHNYLEKLQARQGVTEDPWEKMDYAQQCSVLSCVYRKNHNCEKQVCYGEEQGQAANAANSDNYYHGGGDGNGGCGDDGGGGGRDCAPGRMREVDYKVEELDLGSDHCQSSSVNVEGRTTD